MPVTKDRQSPVHPPSFRDNEAVEFAGLRYRATCRRLLGPSGEAVRLSKPEHRLLMQLLRARGGVIDFRTLALILMVPLEQVADLAANLRRKLVSVGAQWELLRTVLGIGYSLEAWPRRG
jgi:DNA-binding response OmpR family regulator